MKIGVVGLGYVGLPIALAFSRKFEGTIGLDTNERRVESLRNRTDLTGETSLEELAASPLNYTTDPSLLRGCDFFVIAVPTPIDQNNNPNLSALIAASKAVGEVIIPGSTVVFESTVYPGVTEEVCGKAIEETSGLTCGKDFKLGYSPERINPGDKEHTLEKVVKVVAGQDDECLELIAQTYETVIDAGVHRAPSIRVAEAAKVIENTQRDLNIALMNELSMIFDRMDISTKDVLEAASTKWNFLRFFPGLVGGHCIGVDPYYLTAAAERLGYHPQIILAGRRINDGMGKYVAQRTIKLMAKQGVPIRSARIGVLGITFKEDVPDLRNSRVPDIVCELQAFGCNPMVHDPVANAEEAATDCGIKLCGLPELENLDALILAVAHKHFLEDPSYNPKTLLTSSGIFIDVKSAFVPSDLPPSLTYWSL